jgi:hypothetical protein
MFPCFCFVQSECRPLPAAQCPAGRVEQAGLRAAQPPRTAALRCPSACSSVRVVQCGWLFACCAWASWCVGRLRLVNRYRFQITPILWYKPLDVRSRASRSRMSSGLGAPSWRRRPAAAAPGAARPRRAAAGRQPRNYVRPAASTASRPRRAARGPAARRPTPARLRKQREQAGGREGRRGQAGSRDLVLIAADLELELRRDKVTLSQLVDSWLPGVKPPARARREQL